MLGSPYSLLWAGTWLGRAFRLGARVFSYLVFTLLPLFFPKRTPPPRVQSAGKAFCDICPLGQKPSFSFRALEGTTRLMTGILSGEEVSWI